MFEYIAGTYAVYLLGALLLQHFLRRIAHRWTIAFALSHTIVLLYYATDIGHTIFALDAMAKAQVELSWVPIIILDMPASLFRTGTNRAVLAFFENSFEVRTFWVPLVHYGIFGTIQSLVIGRLADAYFRVMR